MPKTLKYDKLISEYLWKSIISCLVQKKILSVAIHSTFYKLKQ